jgi:glc operon protein GlcG
MNTHRIVALLAATACGFLTSAASAQVPQYGPNITYDQAHKVMVAAIADARKQNIPMAVAIVDTGGNLMAFERMDNTQIGSVAVAQDKASSAALFRRSTKVFQDAVAGGGAGLRVLTLRGANAVEGGLPIVIDGKIVGGVGVSGGSAEQDGVVAKAGLDGLAK